MIQMPHDSAFLDHLYDGSNQGLTSGVSSQSCPEIKDPPRQIGGRKRESEPPAYCSPEEQKLWAKERQKKDSHNMSMYYYYIMS